MMSATSICCLLAFGLGTLNAYDEIAFSAAKSGHQYSNGRMVYDKVYLNSDRAYNRYSGIMTAPESGIYTFTYKFVAYYRHSVTMYLYKNSAIVSRSYAYDYYGYANGGNTVILYLRRGDKIWTKNYGYIYGGYYSTFSGYMISSSWDDSSKETEGTSELSEDAPEEIATGDNAEMPMEQLEN